jgi:type IV pilus assembly protein PilW
MSPVRLGARRMRGMSLIELMIALLIGLILLVGVIQVFSASRASYQLSQGVARNQENGRFAMDFLSRDLRMVGHAGCVNDQSLLAQDAAGTVSGGNIRSLFLSGPDRNTNNVAALPFPLRFDLGVQGFEANGTAPGDSLTLSATPAAGSAESWTPALPDDLAGLHPIAGSDIVVVRYFSAEQAPLTALTLGATSTLQYAASDGAVATAGPGLYAIADCSSATVFQAASAPSTTSMSVAVSGLNKSSFSYVSGNDGALSYKAGGTSLFRAETRAYYVALNPTTQVPALYRTRWTSVPGSDAIQATTEEMVEGVESLQLLYGEDAQSDVSLPPSGKITKVNSAATIGDATHAARWRRVGAVQMALLVRDGNMEKSRPLAASHLSLLQVTMTPPDDRRYRAVYETTVAMRNRLFGD